MSLSLHSLFPQKKGAVQSLILLVMVAAMVIGILSVTAAHSKTVTISPIFAAASANQTYNFTITNTAGSATVNEIRVTKPGDFSAIFCLNANPAGGWSCATNGTQSSVAYVEFTGGELAAGSSMSLNITSTSAAGAANYTFQVRTVDTASSINVTDGNANVTVDAHPPVIKLVNITDGTNVIFGGDVSNRTFFLRNSSKGIVFVINVTDNSSGMAQGRVSFYYNVTNVGIANRVIDYRNGTLANHSEHVASNGTFGQLGLYNVTLNLSGLPTLNGSSVAFQIIANDSVKNFNWSNTSMQDAVSSYNYNFTIDAVAPQFVDVILTNGSQDNATNARGINTSSVLGNYVEYIINSTLRLNLTLLVRDDGGSGTVKVEVMNRTGGFMEMALITGANSSSTLTSWMLNGSSGTSNLSGGNYNITDLINTSFTGDGKYNITFRATDNVSNQNATYNFTIEVDDTSPTGNAMTNISINSSTILSMGNTTLDNTTLNASTFVVRLQTSNNINNITRNVSVFGNKGLVYNLTYEGGSTAAGTAIWNLTFGNSTVTRNLTQLCDTLAADGTTCNLRFNFSDAMGRENSSVNLTIAVDGLPPNVSVLSPVFLTTNYTGTALINVSVNDSVGPIQNVSFRIIVASALPGGDEGFYNSTSVNLTNGSGILTTGANMTNWIPMSLGTGSNTQFLTNGTWNYTINLTALNFTDNSYIIQINVTDSSGRQNSTVNRTGVIFDSTPPQNISIINPATNSFQNANFTVNLNATERVAGLLNVSVRLENSTHSFPWVGVNQVIAALATLTNVGETVKFNASTFNITHINGTPTNATNGNFTLRLNVTDTAGNQNTSVTLNFTIDTIVPKISFLTPANSINQTGNFTINVSVTESNVNTVQFRWENGTITNGNSNNGTFANNPMTQGTATTYNGTFTNLTDGSAPLMLDGNYTIRLNITDKAGNYNDTVFIQLVLDAHAPILGADFPAANSIQTANFLVNLSFNDTTTWNRGISNDLAVNTTNINTTSTSPIIAPALFRLENNTFNSSWLNLSFALFDLKDANSNRTNATFTFSSIANGKYNIRFAINDTAGNQNNTVTIGNVTLDNVAPSVTFSILNLTPAASGGSGVSGNITFNATVTDNLPLNISITNNTNAQGQAYGVFFRIENSTFNGSWLPMSTVSFKNFEQNNTGVEHSAIFNLTNNATTLYVDGDYKLRINATDTANNQNTSVFITFTIQNGGSKVRATNLTFQGGYITGSDTNQTSPTFLVNTTTNATCLYSIDTPVTNYDYFLPQTTSNTMGNNVSRQHSTALGFRPDRAANGYSMYYVCKDVGGNFTATDGATSTFTFGVDTRNFFNITMGSGGTNKVRGDYFATGWNSFTLPKTTLLANTGVPTNYNITNVLSSLGNSRLTTANFTTIFAYNGSAWASYVVGASDNTFSNFTSDTPTATYYINITTANERLEIN